MKKPNAKAYGLDNELWEKGGKKAYEAAYLQWSEYCAKYEAKRLPGRARTRPIHESWADYITHFDPTNPERSMGAFCRAVKMSRSALSNALSKPLTGEWNMALDFWIEELEIAEQHEQQ